jgi:DNA-binding NarL/FixJ family response regulator
VKAADSVTVLVADDHTIVREGIRAMLETYPAIEVIAEAENGAVAVARTEEMRPNVVLMDVRMPKMDGLAAARRIKALAPSPAVIMMSSYDDEALMVNAVKAGAAAYLLKDCSSHLLAHTVMVVAQGSVVVKDAILRRAMGEESKPEVGRAATAARSALTERERAIVHCLVEGETNRAIAGQLGIAEVTVKKHVQSIIAKLDARDRVHVAVLATRWGLTE